jgi:hypothetical protein
MQPRNLPAVDALVVLDALDELTALVAGLLLTLDELLPHAATRRVAAPAAVAVINAVCFTVSSPEPGCRCPGVVRSYPGPDCPKVISPRARWEETRRTAATSLLNRDRKPSASWIPG